MSGWDEQRLSCCSSSFASDGRVHDPACRRTITCPRCHRTSHHPDDVREGYCVACHDWTSPRAADR